MSWALTIPEVPPSGNIQKRQHWASYKRLLERWFFLVRAAQGFTKVPPPVGKRRLTITRHGAKLLDRDNLYASMKPVIDALRPMKREEGFFKTGKRKGDYWCRVQLGNGLIVNDDPEHLELVVQQSKIRPGGQPGLVLLLEDIEP